MLLDALKLVSDVDLRQQIEEALNGQPMQTKHQAIEEKKKNNVIDRDQSCLDIINSRLPKSLKWSPLAHAALNMLRFCFIQVFTIFKNIRRIKAC
jgi:hypothetical protein